MDGFISENLGLRCEAQDGTKKASWSSKYNVGPCLIDLCTVKFLNILRILLLSLTIVGGEIPRNRMEIDWK